MSLRRELHALLPIRSELFSLEAADSIDEDAPDEDDPPGDLRITVRTIVWEREGEALSIRDIREQEVVWLLARHREDPRVRAYMEGWAAALQFVFARHAELAAAGALSERARQRLEYAMPHELLSPGVLDLRRPRTADDFTAALLASKQRLAMFSP